MTNHKHLFILGTILLILSLSLVSCAGATLTSETEVPRAFKVAMIFNGRVDDGGWDQSGYEGLRLIEEELGAQVAYTENVTAGAEMEKMFRQYAEEGFDFIIGHGGRFIPHAEVVAEEFPRTNFAVMMGYGGNNKNLGALTTRIGELAYLVGVVAALKTETNKVCFISGLPHVGPQENAILFERGAKATNPAVQVFVEFVGSWGDPDRAREIAQEQIDAGVDVVYTNCGGTANPAVIEEVKKAGLYAIAASPEQRDLAPDTVLTFIITREPILLLKGATLSLLLNRQSVPIWPGLNSGTEPVADR